MSKVTFVDVAERLQRLREARLECETTCKALKEAENEAAAAVLSWMTANGTCSAKVPGLGTMSRKIDIRVHLSDPALMADFMFKRLSDAHAEGKPLTDHLVLQKTAAQTEMINYARGRLPEGADPNDPASLNKVLEPVGFSARAVESLHFSKERAK